MRLWPRLRSARARPQPHNAPVRLAQIAEMSVLEAQSAIRSQVRTAYLGERKVLVRVLGSLNLIVSGDDLGLAPHLMLEGYWESWVTVFFARWIKPGMTVIDVGANIGYYTVLFGNAVGPTGRVIAIEPVPDTVVLLQENVAMNGLGHRTRVVAGAAGAPGADAAGNAYVIVPAGEPKNAAIVSGAEPGSIAVASFTVDALVAGLDRVDLVKIDVEGAEEDVLAGMRQTIATHRPAILLEFNAARYADPAGFLGSLLAVYGSAAMLGEDASLAPVHPETVVTERFGEDRLLFFA